MLSQNDKIARNALPKATMYSDKDLLEMFSSLYQQIQQDNEFVTDITREGLEKFAEQCDIRGLEEGIRKRINELKKG